MHQFSFLQAEFPAIYRFATKAEQSALSDPRGACFSARLALETTIHWLYEHEASLPHALPPQTTLATKINDTAFYHLAGPTICAKARYVKDQGNRAAHDHKPLSRQDAIATVSEFFHIAYWLCRTYCRGDKPNASLMFDPTQLEETLTITASTVKQIQQLSHTLEAEEKRRHEAEAKKLKSEEEYQKLKEELAKTYAQIEALRHANQSVPDQHNYDEATTRSRLIDLLLKEAGWALDQDNDQEFPITGMPTDSGKGRIDYVLWGADGKPLALIEAKRTKKDARNGQHQAKLYADCLEKRYGNRPLIFFTNGYEHWFWDDQAAPPRPVQGFFKKKELELILQRRQISKPLHSVPIDSTIAGRFYQMRAIRRIGESFEKEYRRKALLVMATGTGKTRTAIALIDQLMRANRVHRVLFLADRVALVNQAHHAFKTHLPSAPLANLLKAHNTDNNDHTGARILFSTYPTMLRQVEILEGDIRRFGPAHFDLVIIDEAHRSTYRTNKALFNYFDTLLVGLTATPRQELQRDTYQLFDLEAGTPTDVYDLDDAIKDGVLVPPEGFSIPLQLPRDGAFYDTLSEEEKVEWNSLPWNTDGVIPRYVSGNNFNTRIFNADTIDIVIKQLMQEGIYIEEGTKLGKTIIFARSSHHAKAIIERFDKSYPEFKGHFAQRIDYSISHAQTLIDSFSNPHSLPQIAVSVDMLDTGIDIPEIVNLVFFRPVYSRTKFCQMIGRGTRLCPNLFGPGQDKTGFRIFDYYDNLKTFNEKLKQPEPTIQPSLDEQLFCIRLDLLRAMETPKNSHSTLRTQLTEDVRTHVQSINPNNILARPHQRTLEHFRVNSVWDTLSTEDRKLLSKDIASLPTARYRGEDSLSAKQFDFLLFRTQLAFLEKKSLTRYQKRICTIAHSLEEKANIPLVQEEITRIKALQSTQWWENVTVENLEEVRCKLRSLAELVEADTQTLLYTHFEDKRGSVESVTFSGIGSTVNKNHFKRLVRQFLNDHLDHPSLLKIHRGQSLTSDDLKALEKLFEQGGFDLNERTKADIAAHGGLARFLRSLTKLDQHYVRQAFDRFTQSHQLTATQIEFLDLVISSLSENGFISPETLFESPFTDLDMQGISGLFGEEETQTILSIVRSFDPKEQALDARN